MNKNFFILRRTESEKKIFGGEVYIDIDGKNIGILGTDDFAIELSEGTHTLKMYKSHSMGTFIGIAESSFNIASEEKLFARYSAPLMANQSGTIIISKYESSYQLESLSADIEQQLNHEFQREQKEQLQREEESKKSGNTFFIWIFIVPAVLGVLYWIITMKSIYP